MKRPKIDRLKVNISSSRYILLTFSGVVLFLLIFTTLAWNKIVLSVDGARLNLTTTANTVEQVINKVGLILQPGDKVYPGLQERVKKGMEIKVVRGINCVIMADGQETILRTPPVQVKEVLAKANISLNSNDKISLPLETMVWDGLRIKVTRVMVENITSQYKINPPVTYINDANLNKGKQRLVREGKPGIMERGYTVVYEDGKEVKRTKVGEKVLKAAEKKVIAKGTRPVVKTITVSRGRMIRYTEVKTMEATAYDPGPESCGIYADGYTYTGKKATYGVVAVDPKVIPLGTKLYIEGYGFASAEDIGSAIKNNRIDLCYDTQREAILFGRKKVKVYILAP